MPTPHAPSASVRRALRKLGADMHDARRRRRLTMAVIAERAFTSRATLQRVEAGDPGGQPRHCLSASGCPVVAEGRVAMADVEVYIDLDGTPRPVGLLRRHASRREETVTFEYDETWLIVGGIALAPGFMNAFQTTSLLLRPSGHYRQPALPAASTSKSIRERMLQHRTQGFDRTRETG